MEKVLISSCLLGNKVRYNASCLSIADSDYQWLTANVELVVFCPEVSSGLPTPRAPAEITQGNGFDVIQGDAAVVGNDGIDVTGQFILGAQNTLRVCQENKIRYAILTENSPSCGSSQIYDGTFCGVKIDGSGVTSSLLEQAGITVYNQHAIAALKDALALQQDNKVDQ